MEEDRYKRTDDDKPSISTEIPEIQFQVLFR